ncbi:MAG: NADH-quinone oxidoreductase subunit N [bacterium]
MQLANILPQVVLFCTAVLILLQNVFSGDSRHNLIFGGLGTALALFCSVWIFHGSDFHGLYTDYPSRVGLVLLLVGLGLTFVFSLNREELIGSYTEWSFLFITATLGLSFMVATQHLIMIFLGSQVSFLSLLFLSTFKKNRAGIDAALIYLFSGIIFALFFLAGSSLIFIGSGSFEINNFLIDTQANFYIVFAGFLLLILSLFMKLGLFPFHNCLAQVYSGGPAPVAAFMVTAEKLPVFIVLIRLLNTAGAQGEFSIDPLLWFFAAFTILIVNFKALVAPDLRRMLAYSSIAQTAYPLLGLLVATGSAQTAVIYFLALYILATVNVFAIITFASESADGCCYYPDLAGFSKKYWLLSFCLGVNIFALVGLPPTAGLFGRIFLYRQGLIAGYPGLVLIAAAGTLISAGYYFRIIHQVFLEPSSGDFLTENSLTPLAVVSALVTAILILSGGLFPALIYQPLNSLIEFL